MKYKLYMFDFDLTIADAIEATKTAYRRAFAAVGETFDDEKIFYYLTVPLKTAYYKSEELYAVFQNEFFISSAETSGDVTFYDDVFPLLERIKAEGGKIGLVTNRNPSFMRAFYERHPEFEKIMDCVITSGDVKERKPSPEPILKCLEIMGVDGKDAVYIGDAPNDYKSAVAAGVDFIAIDRYGFNLLTDAKKDLADIA